MAKGQAQVVTEDRGRLIDRAWNATLNALRSLTGRRGEAVVAEEVLRSATLTAE